MISVEIQKNRNEKYVGFCCEGHAEYDAYGKDIVCASVSVLVLNAVNSIEALTKCPMKVKVKKDGDIKVTFPETADDKAEFLVDSMILGLNSILENYGDTYLTIVMKEV